MVDTAGNRERIDVWLQLDKLGMQRLTQVFDYNSNTLIEKVPTFPACNRYTIPDKIVLGDVLKKIFSPNAGIT